MADVVQWEYHVETVNTEYTTRNGEMDMSITGDQLVESQLVPIGSDGWELVGFLPAAPANSNVMQIYHNPWVYYAIFKRPKTS